MYKGEYDYKGEQVAINAPASVKANPDNTITQVSVDTDATDGVITFNVTARRLSVTEPAFEADGTTLLTADLSTGKRTVNVFGGVKQVSTTAVGMTTGTYYKLLSSGGDE